MLASSRFLGIGAGWTGILRKDLCMFTAWLQMSSHFVPFVLLPDSSCWVYSQPTPPPWHGKYEASTFVSTILSDQCDGAWWLPLTGLPWMPYGLGSDWFVAPPSLSGTIPQAYLFLMSLIIDMINRWYASGSSNWTEWSTIQGVNVRVISKSDKHKGWGQFEIMSTVTPWIGTRSNY